MSCPASCTATWPQLIQAAKHTLLNQTDRPKQRQTWTWGSKGLASGLAAACIVIEREILGKKTIQATKALFLFVQLTTLGPPNHWVVEENCKKGSSTGQSSLVSVHGAMHGPIHLLPTQLTA